MEMFSTRPYEEIWIEEIAQLAGVSRGLLYHYFPTKRDFYIEVTRVAAAEVGAVTGPDPTLPPLEQVQVGIGAFLQQAERRSEGFLTAYRGALAGDAEVRAIVDEGRRRQAGRILAVVTDQRSPSPLLRLAVEGWIALAQGVTAQWLNDRRVSRDEVARLLVGALAGAIAAAGGSLPGGDPGPTAVKRQRRRASS
jgi:AcrR family transcriptional regulator